MDAVDSEWDASAFTHKADQALANLRERLAPEDYRLVRQLLHWEELATVAACTAAEHRLCAALVAHFPEHALAVQSVIAHVRATNADCDTLRGRAIHPPRA
jgi:hypothetical protein